LLIEARVDMDTATTDTGTTPLFIAAQRGHVEMVCLPGGTPLYVAALNGHFPVVRLLREASARAAGARAFTACLISHCSISWEYWKETADCIGCSLRKCQGRVHFLAETVAPLVMYCSQAPNAVKKLQLKQMSLNQMAMERERDRDREGEREKERERESRCH
jgi:hypothetical protein